MGGLDPAKLLVILALALVLLGPERLPRAARQVGAFLRDLQAFRQRMEAEVRGALPDLDLPKMPSIPRGGLTGYLTGMMTEADRAGRGAGAQRDGGGREDSETPAARQASRRGEGAPTAQWRSAPSSRWSADENANPSPVTAPAGVPAGWHSRGGDAPGYASGSLLSPVPAGTGEEGLGAEIRLDLSDPSWN